MSTPITLVKPSLVVKTDDTGHVEIDGARINVRELYEREQTSKRSAKKTCPREDVQVPPVLSCNGVVVRGVRIAPNHDAPSEMFGHNGGYCTNGAARCRNHRCRWCDNFSAIINNRIHVAVNAQLSDDEIRANAPIRKCSSCKIEQSSEYFPVDRSTSSGLRSQCYSCKNDSVRRTQTAESRYRGHAKRRAAKLGLPSFPYTPQEIYDAHNGICHLCGKPCELKLETRRGYDIEHLIPLQVDRDQLAVFGIDHPGDVPWNTAIAHPSCNAAKSNRLNAEDVMLYLAQLGRTDWRDLAAVRVPTIEEIDAELND